MKTIGFAAVKGGVGKTSVSISTARRLHDYHGLKVGFVDADFDNSNFAQFTNIEAELKIIDSKEFQLYDWDGIPTFSFSLIAGRERSVSMTGDRYGLMISDVLNSCKWDVDYLLVDLPAGSSDVFRSVMQVFAETLVGNVIIAQPSMVDALNRILNVHYHFQLPVLGIIENMKAFKCPECETSYNLFGDGQTYKIAEEFGVDVLGGLAFDPTVPDKILLGESLFDDENSAIVIDQACRVIKESQIVETGFLQRLKTKVDNKVGELTAELLGKIVKHIKVNLDVAAIRRQTGFLERRILRVVITDETMRRAIIENVFLRFEDDGVVGIRKPDKMTDEEFIRRHVDFEVLMSYRTFARVIMRQRMINGELDRYDASDAWYMNDLVVRGDGSSPKTVHAIRSIFLNDSIMDIIANKYDKALRRFL